MYTQWAPRGEPYTMIVLRVRGAQEPCVPSIAPSKPPVTSPSQPPNPSNRTTSLVPSWPSRIQCGMERSKGQNLCCYSFITSDVSLLSSSPMVYSRQNVRQNVCEDSQPSQWLFKKKKKKNELGQMRVGNRAAFPSVSCRVSAFRTRKKRTVGPHLCLPSSSGGLSLLVGPRWVQRQHPVGRIAKEDFFEPCCCF